MSLVTLKDVEPMGQLEPRDEGRVAKAEVSRDKKKEFVEKKAWEVATGPGKQFLMTGRLHYDTIPVQSYMSVVFNRLGTSRQEQRAGTDSCRKEARGV